MVTTRKERREGVDSVELRHVDGWVGGVDEEESVDVLSD
jgi:hypothetical protein